MPANGDAIRPLDGSAGSPDDLARLSLLRYGHDYWSAARIEAEIAQVGAWSRKHNVRVTCNEFGVYRRVAPSSDRATWIADVRMILERQGIGWNLWDYAGDFGLVTKQAGTILPDDTVVAALGLRGSTRE